MNKPFASRCFHIRKQLIRKLILPLPGVLLLLAGIVEGYRLLWAWRAVENAARWGTRYAVTGKYDVQYCAEAAEALNLEEEDTFGGDPLDCDVPEGVADFEELTAQLEDWARLPTIRDRARQGGSGLWINDKVSGNYLRFLAEKDPLAQVPWLGSPSLAGYFHVTVCSNRDSDDPPDGAGNFANVLDQGDPPQCRLQENSLFMDDAGGPGDRVRVTVTFRYAVMVPLLNRVFPTVRLSAYREGIVEWSGPGRITPSNSPRLWQLGEKWVPIGKVGEMNFALPLAGCHDKSP